MARRTATLLSPSRRWTANRTALAIGLGFVLLALVYASVTPIFEAPDEASHFLYIHNLLNQHDLSIMQPWAVMHDSATPPEVRYSLQIHHPPLYYLIGAALISWTDRGDVLDHLRLNPLASIGFVNVNNLNANLHNPGPARGDTITAVRVLRFYSILLGLGTLWFIYRTGQMAFGSRVGLLAMLLVASMPGFVYISSSISNDNLVTFLYAAGVGWYVRVWRRQVLTWRDMLAVSAILGMIALSKLPGLTLFVVGYLSLVYGLYRHRYPWRSVVRLISLSLTITAALAGWWYARNQLLYGDPLGMQATLNIWWRGLPPSDLHDILFEAKGVWESFWMILGHLNLRGPEWLYAYVGLITIIGTAGCLRLLRQPARRDYVLLLGMVCGVVLGALAVATRQVNISQGRILFPALVAFAPLLAAGWQSSVGRRFAVWLALPLTALALLSPAYLARAFRPLMPVANLPAEARRIDARAESLTFVGYQLETETVTPGDTIRLQLYFSGPHVEDPVLFVKALDPVTQTPLGSVDTYPGMAPTSALEPGQIYRAAIALRLDDNASHGLGPSRLDFSLGWRVPVIDRFIPMTDSQGNALAGLLVPGPTLLDPGQPARTPTYPADVTFGAAIRLVGYDLSGERLAPGDTLTVSWHWRMLKPLDRDWMAAVGLLDANHQVVVSADGGVAGYPTSAWRSGPDFVDTRTLTIPAAAPENLRLYLAWYDPANGERLTVSGAPIEGNNLYLAPIAINVP